MSHRISGGVLAAWVAVLTLAATAGAPAAAVNVRKPFNELSSEEVADLKKGVAIMQGRDADDPTSWIYQANMHGYPADSSICPQTPGSPQTAWASCQHGNFFFLAWHRMYLYYFERILRAAVREGTGDPSRAFALGSDEWKTQTFTFFDEGKHQVTLTGCQVLDMATQLDYQYENLAVNNVQLCSKSVAVATPAAAPREELASSRRAVRALGNAPVTVDVPLSSRVRRRMAAIASQGGRLRLEIEGIKLLHPGAVYRVYLDLPGGRRPDPHPRLGDPAFLGNIALFGETGHHATESVRSFDLAARAAGLRGHRLSLTFVRGNPGGKAPAGKKLKEPKAFLRLTRVRVVAG